MESVIGTILDLTYKISSVDSDKIAGVICALVFIVGGVVWMILLYNTTFGKISHCTLEIEACVKEVHIMLGSGRAGRRMRRYFFSFIYGGREYIVSDALSVSGDEQRFEIGDKVLIKIDPENPSSFYRSRPDAYISSFVLGLLVIGFGILILCSV